MSYYIRVLAEFPQAFEWLRRRAWRQKNRLTQTHEQPDFAAMFPDLRSRLVVIECKTSAQESPPSRTPLGRLGQRRPNPALGLTRVAFVTR